MNALDTSRAARLERQQGALLQLSRRWRWYEADLDKAVVAVVEAATVALAIERASVWFYNEEHDALLCHDLYEATPRRHSRGTVLHAGDHVAYFEAMRAEEVIAANDAHADPRTAGFSGSYLTPLGIGAMLDAPIRFGGRAVGVLCNEHVGGARHFSTDEQNTATYLANLVSLAYEFQRRARSDHESAHALSLLRAAFEATGAGILAVDRSGAVNTYNRQFLGLWRMPESLVGPNSDPGARLAHVAALAREPQALAERVTQALADTISESRDVFELEDGRSIECISQPQRLDGAVVGRVWSFRDVTNQRRIERELRELAIEDALTGLANRRRAEEGLEQEAGRARRSGCPLSIALLDIDHFKRINDTHGHQVGDHVLRVIGADLRSRVRKTDLACRWGGEELLLILPDTNRSGAHRLVDELRRHIGRDRGELPTCTISAGVAEYDGVQPCHELVAAADARLYEAKAAGRDRVV